jgi:hypothetical protein
MSDGNLKIVRRFFEVGLDADSLIELGIVDRDLSFVPGPGSLTTGTLSAKGFEDVVRDIASQFDAYEGDRPVGSWTRASGSSSSYAVA